MKDIRLIESPGRSWRWTCWLAPYAGPGFLACWFWLSPTAHADPLRPTDRLAKFEAMFNSSDTILVDSFVLNQFADVDSAKLMRMRSAFRRLKGELKSIRVAELNDMSDGSRFVAGHAIVQTGSTQEWKNFQFFTSPEQDGRFTSFALVDAIQPKQLPEGGLSDPEVQQWLSEHIAWLASAHHLSGSFAVAEAGHIVFQEQCGWADHERQIENSAATLFNMASGSKMFTAVAIAQLVERSELAFDDTLGAYLAGLVTAPGASAITVSQLLTHTSGLPEYWTESYEAAWDRITQLDQFLPFFANQPLVFRPGSQFEYCNTNFIVLGLILEEATGIDFYAYIQENLFKPAGMTQAGYFEMGDATRALAVPYDVVLPGEQGSTETWLSAVLGKRGSSAGGAYATVQDIVRFDSALNHGVLLSPPMTNMVTSGKVEQPVGGLYGFGFIEGEYEGQRWFGHGGTAPGVFFNYVHFSKSGYSIVYCANHQATAAHDVFNKLRQAVLQSG